MRSIYLTSVVYLMALLMLSAFNEFGVTGNQDIVSLVVNAIVFIPFLFISVSNLPIVLCWVLAVFIWLCWAYSLIVLAYERGFLRRSVS